MYIDVINANGCIYSESDTITICSAVTAIETTLVNERCGRSDGSVTLGSVTGGVAPYTYNFNTLGYSGATVYSNLAAGTYSLDVKDANGCIYSTSVTVSNSGGATAIATTIVNESCGASNGSVTLGTVTGGLAPYTYNFNNLGYSGTTVYNGLAAGTYT